MAVPSPLVASSLALAASAWFFWLAPYLAWRSQPSFAWGLLAKGVALCGLVHHVSFVFFQGVNLLLLEGYRPCEFLGAAAEHLEPPALYVRFPTLLWLLGADACGPLVLSSLLAAGGLCSLLAFLGVLQPLAFLGQYAALMSLATVGGQVLQYPWDILLCEASFLAVWLPPPARPGVAAPERPPPRLVRWAFRLLVLKSVGMSGLMKFYDNADTAWADWSYTKRYFEWQGFPTWAALVAFHAPKLAHDALHCSVWFSQAVCPVLMLVPVEGLQRLAAVAVILEMQGIQLLGNYGIFNVLTAVLVLPCLGSRRGGGTKFPAGAPASPQLGRLSRLHRALGTAVCAVLISFGCFHLCVYLAGGQTVLGINPQGQPEYLWFFPPDAGPAYPPRRQLGDAAYGKLASWLQHGRWPQALRLAAVWRVANTVGVFRGHPAGRLAFTISLTCSGDRWHDVVPPHAAPQSVFETPAASLAFQWIAPLQSRMDQVYTHNGMYLSPFVGYNTHVFGDFYHKFEALLLPALVLGLLSDCCCTGAAGRDPWGPWAMHSPLALPPGCARPATGSGHAGACGNGSRGAELARAVVRWHRYHFEDLSEVMRGKAPFRRGELLLAFNWTHAELDGLVRQSLVDASELLRWQLAGEGWRLRPRLPSRPAARASGADIYFADLRRIYQAYAFASSVSPRTPRDLGRTRAVASNEL